MLIEIKKNDYLPGGLYILQNPYKIERAKNSLPADASERDILIEYDKIGGFITNTNRQKILMHTFWNLEKQKKAESVENLLDAELLAIIRKTENPNVPGSRYQRANTEWQIRHQQKLLEATRGGRGGISFEVGGDMINDGTIQTDTNALVDINVAGNYTSKKGKIIQGNNELRRAWWKKPEIMVPIVITALSIPWWPNLFHLLGLY